MQHHTHPLPSPVPGTHRALDSFHYGPADAEKRIYIQASLHADELPGMLVAWKLKQRLARLEADSSLQARVVLVPVANPIGLDQQLMDTPLGRYDLESVTNFNRGYHDVTDEIAEGLAEALTQDPEHNKAEIRRRFEAALETRQASSSHETLHLMQQRLACNADFILDLHCDFNAVEHLYTTPAAWPDFEPLARYYGAKASMLATDSGGASFDECFTLVWERLRERFGERFPIPYGSQSITLELRGQQDIEHTLAERDANAILNWLTHLGLIDGEAPPLPDLAYPATDLAAMDFLHAPAGGLIVFHREPGRVVEAGELIAEIIDPITDVVHELRAEQRGMFYARTQRRMATAGMIVADVAGHEVRRSGYLLAP
ncbi:succinylglutamate desuccinylase/aspartoacylase family protein [Halomonas eurihalina]|uniref:Succinylglutamate desuccinylase/aspartoacylase family protein n=1 Tax=Halomonas eurihalina TaxID=42566 RepID=A0A5D9D6N3_HALER|nr:succinylglutamate desuccinylase/aspartoacylase family protein [Halomonas eurihalina]MDR5860001.1 M14 family metallopeptidase [Halomonas eurihalina]TZG39818.1 succinylglutamate desuccinylase/aspartoacylase family protein [Halomonas eurihalina]